MASNFRLLTVALLAGVIAPIQAHAVECRQEKAIYEDRDEGYEFRFEPVGSQAAATSHHFKVHVLGSGLVLDGIVMTSGDDVPRPGGMIMNNCPEGDATGDEIAACTVWEGVVYSVEQSGVVGVLPPADQQAAQQLLFPGLGPAIRYSSIWDEKKPTVAPWDVLVMKGCGQ
ncbi:hypothetical protein [Sinorhizobium sp. BG8]|uniref:hypothetical protein n=1 Tax=Sinorhizobium sp. BG8 TaxID=2613773 RepID=UPI00193CAC13|nr:hypothetical protein [Sinorhizobium sp. BG8]QRM53432.1 hypothetical protein F3Y30_01795 [Sinorhizobium sp. BG8]